MLVVERNSIVALDVEDMLLRNGAAHVTVATEAAEALSALAVDTFHAALLDLHLATGGSLVVAARLQERGVPFAFITDYGDRPALPAPFTGRPILGKPCSERYLVSQLAGLLSPL
ncbi:MAG: response regulator [Bacteroidota bacterium]